MEDNKTCGIIMPISPIDGCDARHWAEVKLVLSEVIESCGFKARIVSEGTESNLIHKRIVQNVYNDEIVVCDVSCHNPNVMFELGMRLAFDKPTVIVMDDSTSFCFDTGLIEHLIYPRDLGYIATCKFKLQLAEKIKATVEAAKSDGYSTF